MASNDGNSSWWGNWIKTAKEKSMNALEIMKTDLAEFTSTMTADLNQAIDPNATQSLLSTTISYITGEIDNISGKGPTTTNDATDSSAPTMNIKMSLQDRYKEELTTLQNTESTYLTDPKPEVADEFSEWFTTFDPDNYKAEISNLLIEQADMRLLYSQLVPAKISNAQFWGRYFFKVNQLEEDHKKRAKLIERADEIITTEKETTDWDEDLDEENKTIEKVDDQETEQAQDAKTEPTNAEEVPSEEPTVPKETEPTEAAESTPAETSDKMISSQSDSQIVDADSIELKSNSSTSSSSTMSNKVDKLEMSQKTEDSDDWEKVSDGVANDESDKNKLPGEVEDEVAEKSEPEHDDEEASDTDLNKTPTSKPSQKEGEDDTEPEPSKSKKKNEDDWDDWE